MIFHARMVRSVLAGAIAAMLLAAASRPVHPQSTTITVRETWFSPLQDGTDWERLMVAAVLENETDDLLRVRRIRTQLLAGERTIVDVDASGCAAKTVLEAGERVDEVEFFFGMRPLPTGEQPIDWAVTDTSWSVVERDGGDVLNVAATISNHSAVASEAQITTYLVEADGSYFMSTARSADLVEAGGLIEFRETPQVKVLGYYDAVVDVQVHVSSLETITQPPPSPYPTAVATSPAISGAPIYFPLLGSPLED
jgi:hypothetical protein